jgi:catechol 2,3-dioxygenase-like lactoylglutathione lyase family enzyme
MAALVAAIHAPALDYPFQIEIMDGRDKPGHDDVVVEYPSNYSKAERNMARITGLGGVFFKAKDPKALSAWYRDTLGIPIEDWGGALLNGDSGPPHVVWSPFSAATDHFKPSTREFMINFAVDDMDAFLATLTAKGVEILGRDDQTYGKFAWIMDPDGTKVEFWQPA